MTFGENLLALRKEKHLSQDELGGELHVSRQTISKWELNETTPEMEKLVLMSAFFDVSMDELIKGSTPIKNEEIRSIPKTNRDIIFLIIKIIGILIATFLFIDVIIMLIYFLKNGFPPL